MRDAKRYYVEAGDGWWKVKAVARDGRIVEIGGFPVAWRAYQLVSDCYGGRA